MRAPTAEILPWPTLTLPAPYLCPVLEPLVELKYPVVGLVPVRRVPPAQRAQQAIRGEGSHRGWRGPEPTVGTFTAPLGLAESEQPSHKLQPASMLALLRPPHHRHKLPPSRVHTSPPCLPDSRLQVRGWVHRSRSSSGKRYRHISASRDLPAHHSSSFPGCTRQSG